MTGKQPRDNYGGFGPERQNDIFMRGVSGEKPDPPIRPEELEAAARAKLPREAFDFVAGGSGSEETVAANIEAFRRWRIVTSTLTNVAKRDTRIELLGRMLPAPFLLAPVGQLSIVHSEGVLAVARAAASLGLPMILSTVSSHSIEEAASQMGTSPRWFQLCPGTDNDLNASFVSRAEASGYEAVVLTLDCKTGGWRERDLQSGYSPSYRGGGAAIHLSDSALMKRLAASGEDQRQAAARGAFRVGTDPGFDARALKQVCDSTRLPILVKGVLSASDARLAVDAGAEGIIVSNHGGRQLDGVMASLDALPDVVEEVDGVVPVLFDSGIRRGVDAFKAIALGADAVLVGRPYVWGLALGGEKGIVEVMQNILAHFDVAMALSGTATVEEIGPDLIRSV
jgi:lactate 2-monooxygenase